MKELFIVFYLTNQIYAAYYDQEPIKGGYSPFTHHERKMLNQPEMYVSGSLNSQNWNGMETSGSLTIL